MRRGVVLLLALAACEKKPPPVPPDAGTLVIPSTSAAPAETIVVAPVDAAVAPPRVTAEETTESTPGDKAARAGNVVAWSVIDGDFSKILVMEDKKPAHLVRRTSGEVSEIRLVKTSDGDYAVAWVSALVGGKGQVSAVSFVSADLGKVSAPTTLALLGKPSIDGHIAMLKSPRGGVVIAHEGAGTDATVTFEVKAVSPDGKVDKLGASKVPGGPSPELWMVDLEERGVLVYGSSMAGGRTQETLLVPWTSGEAAPSFTAPVCGGVAGITPEALRGTNGEVVALCIDMRFGDKLDSCKKPRRDDPERCLRLAASAKDGTPITAEKVWDTPVSKVECVGRHVKLSFPLGPTGSGGSVTLASPSEHVADWLDKKCE